MKEQDLIQLLRLSLIDGVGPTIGKKLVSYLGGAEGVFRASRKDFVAIDGIGSSHYDLLHSTNTQHLAEAVFRDCQDWGIDILTYVDSNYPPKLKAIVDGPMILYFQGDRQSLSHSRVLSVVGTRNATRYGLDMTDKLVRECTKRKVLILSGMAFGIDTAAHRSSINSGGRTIGVMAHGLDRVSPVENKALADKMKVKGGLLTEHRLGVKVEKGFFPMRNRIVAGMADATVVVESDIRGGSLITAQLANGYHRDVFAIPGRFDDRYSRGCHELIRKNQAHILDDITAFLKMMNWDEEPEVKGDIQIPLFSDVEGDELRIIKSLSREAKTVDLICLEVELPMSRVSSTLLSLEFKGLVRSLPGKQYALSISS